MSEGLLQFGERLDVWQRRNASSMPYAAIGVATLAVFLLQAVFRFNPGLGPLYVIPLWASVTLLGARRTFLTILGLSLIATLGRPHGSIVSGARMFEVFVAYLVGFSLVAVVIHRFERIVNHLKGLAYRDALTGLLNRHGLAEFGQKLLRMRSKDATVVVIDCDGFKQVNDLYGHKAGDHILKMLARVLEGETRSQDALVRIGGDEFALILHSASVAEARSILERVQGVFEQAVADAGYDCSISFGIAEPDDNEELDDVLAKADAAMYSHKRGKRQGSYVC